MPDPPPYGFHPEFLPCGQMEQNIPTYYNSAVELSYPMPHPETAGNAAFVTLNAEQLDITSNTSSEESIAASYRLDYSMYPPIGYCWQSLTALDPFPLQHAVRAGKDQDGCNIYVGRAFHEGDMIPAKVIPEKNIAYISYAGEEVAKEEFEILRTGDFVWEFAANGEVPEGAVEVGRTADGEKLYMGRCLYQGTQTPGKLHPTHGCLYIPFDGQEVSVNEYEVLIVK